MEERGRVEDSAPVKLPRKDDHVVHTDGQRQERNHLGCPRDDDDDKRTANKTVGEQDTKCQHMGYTQPNSRGFVLNLAVQISATHYNIG